MSFRPLTRIHLLLTPIVEGVQTPWVWFPTSDEDSSTPDSVPRNRQPGRFFCFRPLTRIHLLLTKRRDVL